MRTIKVDIDRAVELTKQYMAELYDTGISRPSGDKVVHEEPLAKISACLNTAATIAVGITGGSYEDVEMLHQALTQTIDSYFSYAGFQYVSNKESDNE